MKKTAYYLLYVTIVVTLLSCGSHRPTLKNLEKEQGNYSISYDASKRGSIISIDKEGKIDKVLAEVQPDVALSNALEFTSKLKAKEEFSAEQVTKITESLTVLGERTAAVNILRDALFRIEEHCINFPENCKEGQYWQRFDAVLNAVKEIQTTSQIQAIEKIKQEEFKLKQLEKNSKFGIEN